MTGNPSRTCACICMRMRTIRACVSVNVRASERACVRTCVFLHASLRHRSTVGCGEFATTLLCTQVIVDSAVSLSYEIHPQFELLVTATDGGGQAVTATVIIDLIPYNDAVPVFTPSNTYTCVRYIRLIRHLMFVRTRVWCRPARARACMCSA